MVGVGRLKRMIVELEILPHEPACPGGDRRHDPEQQHARGETCAGIAREEPREHGTRISEQRGRVEAHQQQDAREVHGIGEHEREQRALDRVIAEQRDGGEDKAIVRDGDEQPDAQRDADTAQAILGAERDENAIAVNAHVNAAPTSSSVAIAPRNVGSPPPRITNGAATPTRIPTVAGNASPA